MCKGAHRSYTGNGRAFSDRTGKAGGYVARSDPHTEGEEALGSGVIAYRRRDGREEPFSLLLVDDAADHRQKLADLLESLGFSILQADCGETAVQIAIAERPDLILMDLVMPGIDGVETTRRILSVPGLAATPIIACSACAFDQDRANSREAGCRTHLPKPIQRAQLLEVLPQCLPIVWAYANEPSHVTVEEGWALNTQQRKLLLDWILRGNVIAIRCYLEQPVILADANPRLHKLRGLAAHCDLKQMRQLVERDW